MRNLKVVGDNSCWRSLSSFWSWTSLRRAMKIHPQLSCWTVLSFIWFFSLSCILTVVQISFNHTICSSVFFVWTFIMWVWLKAYLFLPNFLLHVAGLWTARSCLTMFKVSAWFSVWLNFLTVCLGRLPESMRIDIGSHLVGNIFISQLLNPLLLTVSFIV